MKNHSKIPTTIVTGFLGSGKTTLLKNMLTNADGRRIAVIVNEFGELGIDGEILKSCGLGCDAQSDEQDGVETESEVTSLYELANGCLCCTVQEEFYPVMQQLIERRDCLDHILIETSGLALPKPLVQAFNWPEIKNACTVDAVITLVDTPAVAAGQFADNPEAVAAQRQADENLDHDSSLHELFEDQISAADLVILSKTDLAATEALDAVKCEVQKKLPESVKMIDSDGSNLDLQLVLGLHKSSEESTHYRHSHHNHNHDHNHDQFDSIILKLPIVDKTSLFDALQRLVAEKTIYRIKGFAALPGKPMRLLLHAVGKRFDSYFDRHWQSDETPSTTLVLIGKDLDSIQLQNKLEAELMVAGVP